MKDLQELNDRIKLTEYMIKITKEVIASDDGKSERVKKIAKELPEMEEQLEILKLLRKLTTDKEDNKNENVTNN